MRFFYPNRLSVQLVFSSLAVVLLTAALIGLPSIWLLQNQLDQQAWAQVEQAERTALSLYEKKAFELKNAANLIAQRPTLTTMLDRSDYQSLAGYLTTLQSGAGLDLIHICQADQILAAAQHQAAFCMGPDHSGYFFTDGSAWLIARTWLKEQEQIEVVVGIALDDDFAQEIRDQIGLDQAFYYQGQLINSSYQPGEEPVTDLQDCIDGNSDQLPHLTCRGGDSDHYLTISSLDDKDFAVAVAMDLSEISRAEIRLMLWMSAAMVAIAGMVTLLGVVLSRRISRPLVNLSRTALSFSRGDLETPVVTTSRLEEITRVAGALDDARRDLRGMLSSLQDERDWSENLLSSIMEGIITLDESGQVTFFSRGAERLTGLLQSEAVGEHINDLFPLADSRDHFFSLFTSTSSEGYQKMDVLLADDQITSLAITSARLTRSGSKAGETALVIRDISEEEAVHRLLGHFLANVSHELRTPLTALEASIDMLLDPASNLDGEEKIRLYTSLHLGIFRLHTLVDNLLESANIEARRFRISPRVTDLAPIVAEAVQTMQPLIFKYEQHLSVKMPLDPPHVQADKRRIVQVLVNLISNANKYGPPGGEISVEVSAGLDVVRLAVLDRGPGIPQDQQEHLFSRFVYPQAGSEISQAGAGLGLSVVKAIVEAHGGEVGMKERSGGGSEFWFTLPLASEE